MMRLMQSIFYGFLIVFSVQEISGRYNIGFLTVATGKYINFIEPLIRSAKKHFCTNHAVHYFIFTDTHMPSTEDTTIIFQKKLGWPYDSMMRYAMYASNKNLFKDMDYLFACDSDMLFVDTVGDEILGDRVATLHPAWVGSKGTYENRPISIAYIDRNIQGKNYYAGGFNGGKMQEFCDMAQAITKNIYFDLQNRIVAICHDESHLNRFYVDNEPTVILSPSYCYWQGKILPYQQRLVALNKNHDEYRK